MRLRGKQCIITGAGSGIGQAAAVLFAREGARVAAADLDLGAARRTVEEIQAGGGEGLPVQVDVSAADQIQRMMQEVLAAYGRIDVLVNNAGYGFAATVEETTEEAWDGIVAVNLKGVYLGCKYVIPIMRRQGGGVILNTASVVATVGIANRAAYCATKGGVAALTRAMAVDHAKDGIRINAIGPGTVETPYFTDIFAESDNPVALRKSFEGRQIVNRLGRPEEIAQAMLFLASDESSFVTGSLMLVDGGMSAW